MKKFIHKQVRRSILQKKFQIISMFLLTVLISICFNYLIGGMIVVNQTYQNQLNHSNLEDFRMLPKIEWDDYMDEIVQDYNIDVNDLNNISEKELIEKYGISMSDYDSQVMDILAEKYLFTYQLYEESIFKEDNLSYFITPYNKNISNFTLIEGGFPDQQQVSITYQYAQQNNIKLNDTIEILDESYKVSGLHTGPLHNFLYSHQHSESIMIDSNIGVIMNKQDFNKHDFEKSYVYLATFNDTVKDTNVTLKNIESDPNVSLFILPKDVPSINNIENDISTNTYLGIVAISILALTIFVIQIILIRNQLYELNPDLGILLAIGVKKSSIIQAFYFYIIIMMVAIILGSFIGIQLQQLTFTQMEFIYNIQNMVPYEMTYPLLFGLVFVTLFALLILLFVIMKLNQHPLNMIDKITSNNKSYSILVTIKKLAKLKSFSKRIKTSFTYKNIGFLFTLTFSIIIIFNLFLIGLNLITSNQTSYHNYVDSIKYESIDILSSTQTAHEDESNIGYAGTYTIESVNSHTIDDSIDILGIKESNTYYENVQVEQDKLIINKKLAYKYNIDSSDSITINFNGHSFTFNQIEVNTNPFDSNNYTSIDQLWESDKETENGQYNLTYNNPSGSNVLYSTSKEDDVQLVNESLLQMNTLIIVLFIATTFISIILLILIANLTINENVQAINILNMLGYSYPRIFYLSTDVFKLPIVFSFILAMSINPFMTNLLEKIINHNNSSIFIEINSSFVSIFLSMMIILVIYYLVFIFNFLIYIRRIEK